MLGTVARQMLQAPAAARPAHTVLNEQIRRRFDSADAVFLLIVLALFGMCLGGNASKLGLPISPDRVFLALAIGVAASDRTLRSSLASALQRWHVVFLVPIAIAIGSALHVGTLTTTAGLFAILDSLGVVPFLLFIFVPVLVDSPARLRVLLTALIGMGAYLGATAFFEVLGPHSFVWPGYIVDPGAGILFGRARGPFLQPAANGMVMLTSAVACVIALRTWRRRAVKVGAVLSLVLCLVGAALTLTRSVWIAETLTVFVLALTSGAARKLVLPGIAALALGVFALVTLVPPVQTAVDSRLSDTRSGYDRLIANDAAMRVLEQNPLTGVGWQRFSQVEGDWVRQDPDYSITNVGISVHNVLLGYAAEIGLPGAASWLVCFVAATAIAVRARPGSAVSKAWQHGLFAVVIGWVVVAMLAPVNYSLPNALLWLWLGLVPHLCHAGSGPAGRGRSESRPSGPLPVSTR
nr:O-antigen ligase family protein [Motilibacter deserti]